MNTEPLIRIDALSKTFSQRRGVLAARAEVPAVREVSLGVASGETLGVVGESGCGKSTLGRMAIGLLEPSGGEVFIRGQALYNKTAHPDYAAFRRGLVGVVQMVFQDPYSSLNPRMKVGESIAEPLRCSSAWLGQCQGKASEQTIRERTAAMLRQVGLDADAASRYPHEFSGGQRQRIAIARALVTRPAFVVCDEPTSSLDASVQSQVLNLLRDMQDELGLTYMFISHDLAVVRHMSDRVAVMYQGLIVEEGESETLFASPLHPYTRLLLSSVPDAREIDAPPHVRPGENGADRLVEPAPIPDAENSPEGCLFAPRCPEVMPVCHGKRPELKPAQEAGGHRVRCRLFTDKPLMC